MSIPEWDRMVEMQKTHNRVLSGIMAKSWEAKLAKELTSPPFFTPSPFVVPTLWQRFKRLLANIHNYRLRNPFHIPEEE